MEFLPDNGDNRREQERPKHKVAAIGIGGSLAAPPTGSREAVARLPLPQNVACGFTALRSSAVGSQHSLLFVQVSFPWSADLLFA